MTVELITGPMFSGKSLELTGRLRVAKEKASESVPASPRSTSTAAGW